MCEVLFFNKVLTGLWERAEEPVVDNARQLCVLVESNIIDSFLCLNLPGHEVS